MIDQPDQCAAHRDDVVVRVGREDEDPLGVDRVKRLITVARLPAFIATLAMMTVARGLAKRDAEAVSDANRARLKLIADESREWAGRFGDVETMGGMTKAVESGMPKLKIEESAARRQASR